MKLVCKAEIVADFYIARVGTQAGKPMKDNYTANNSIAVFSENPEVDFAKAEHLYISGGYRPYIVGSCQPSLRVRDVRHLLTNHVVSQKTLIMLAQMQKVIELKKKELACHEEMLLTIARLP